MRVAIVLYGQPRNFQEGYRNIQMLCQRNQGCKFEFYYHCWILPHGKSFQTSPWRKIDPSHLIYQDDTKIKLEGLYHPVLCEYTDQSTIVHSAPSEYTFVNNDKNILDQMYSRAKARNLLIESGRTYDRIIMTRFDINTPIHLDILSSDDSVYVQSYHLPRKIFADHTCMSTQEVFYVWFDLYDRIFDFQKDDKLKDLVESYHEHISINAEELIFASYLFHFKSLDRIKYFNGGYSQ